MTATMSCRLSHLAGVRQDAWLAQHPRGKHYVLKLRGATYLADVRQSARVAITVLTNQSLKHM